MQALRSLGARELGGFDALETVTRLVPSATIVILTRYATYDTALRALRAGAYDYIVKPVNFEDFAVAVQTLGMYWLLLNQSPKM